MRCKTVAQHVGRQSLAESGLSSVFPERLPVRDPVHLPSSLVQEQMGRRTLAQQLRPARREIAPDARQCLAPDGNQAFFVAFSDAAQTALLGVEIGEAQ